MLGINEVNDVIISGRLSPALVSPVAAVIGKHAGEVTNSGNTRPWKTGAAVRVNPSVAAVRGSVNFVDVVVGETAASFVHAGNVEITCGKVTGNLDIADETGDDIYRAMPGSSIITGVGHEEGTAADIVVVPGDVHAAVERRRRVVISPTRLSVVVVVAVNTIMAPAIGVPRSRRLVSSKALPAATTIEPDSEPSGRWLIVQDNRVAHGIVEWTLTARLRQASECCTAVGGDRCAGNIYRRDIAAS